VHLVSDLGPQYLLQHKAIPVVLGYGELLSTYYYFYRLLLPDRVTYQCCAAALDKLDH
jgi:hypothetical protein